MRMRSAGVVVGVVGVHVGRGVVRGMGRTTTSASRAAGKTKAGGGAATTTTTSSLTSSTTSASGDELASLTPARGAELQLVGGAGVRLQVQVKPASKHNEVLKIDAEAVHVRIAAPAQEGRANEELISFLSDQLGVRQSMLRVARGATGRTKTILVGGVSIDELRSRLHVLKQDALDEEA